MSHADVVLASISPNGNVEACVEQDERVAHFYLSGAPGTQFGVRSCWVRNLKPAPDTLDMASMRAGIAPMMPAQHCAHPDGASPLSESDLEIVWLEEGDAAALLERGEILAVIPCWSGESGFHGYARDCGGEAPLSWELAQDNVLRERVARARELWASWDSEPHPWKGVQQGGCAAVARQLGKEDKYYAIDGGSWPPKALLRVPIAEGSVLVTVGVCLRPQPRVEMHTEDPAPYRRIELGLCLSPGTPEAALGEAAAYVSGQSGYPWNHFTWLGPGHTMPCDMFSRSSHLPQFSAVLFVRDRLDTPSLAIPRFRGDPVHVLWMLAITERERQYAVDHGSEVLLAQMEREGVNWVSGPRDELRLE